MEQQSPAGGTDKMYTLLLDIVGLVVWNFKMQR